MTDDTKALIATLRNRTEMVNYGNGDVRDIPDEDCTKAADALERLSVSRPADIAEIEERHIEHSSGHHSDKWLVAISKAFEDRGTLLATIKSLTGELAAMRGIMTVLTECRKDIWVGNPGVHYVFRFGDEQNKRLSDAYRAALTKGEG